MQLSQTPRVSVIIPTHCAQSSIGRCLAGVLENHFSDFEVLLVDDASSDATYLILNSFQDPRVQIHRNSEIRGAAASRNRGIESARGEFVFFLDADCIPTPDWIESGLRAFSSPDVVAVEGEVFYGNERPSLRDKIPINPLYNLRKVCPITEPGRDFAASNIAYRRRVLVDERGFDTKDFQAGREDTDLGRRAQGRGKIAFSETMKVVHLPANWDFSSLMENAKRYSADVKYYSRHKEFPYRMGPVLHPKLLLMLVVPPFFLKWAFPYVRSVTDFFFLAPLYVYLAALRFHIWRQALQSRTFVL